MFNDKYPERKVEVPKVNVIGGVVLSDDETNLLANNPKLALYNKYDEEVLEREI